MTGGARETADRVAIEALRALNGGEEARRKWLTEHGIEDQGWEGAQLSLNVAMHALSMIWRPEEYAARGGEQRGE